MRLDLDGILEVAAVEKRTGKSKQITIANALAAKSRRRLRPGGSAFRRCSNRAPRVFPAISRSPLRSIATSSKRSRLKWCPERASLPGEREAEDLMERSRKLLDRMHADDREDAIGLHEKIGAAIESGDGLALAEASRALREMLFFMEGKPN